MGTELNQLTRDERPSAGGHLGPARSARRPSQPFAGEPEERNLLAEYLQVLSRYRWRVAAIALLGGVLGVLLTIASLPVFRTRTSLEIRSLNSSFMNLHDVSQTGSDSAAEGDINLQTQIKILQSESLTEQTNQRLLAQPHPASVERDDMLSRFLRVLHLPHAAPLSYEELVDDTAQRTKVKPLGVTRLVEITCESLNAKFSAQYCNALTTQFEDHDMNTRTAEAQKTSVWLGKQLADVGQKADDSRKKLEASLGGNGLMLSQDTTSVGEERLRELQDELVKAESDRMQKEAQVALQRSATTSSLGVVQDDPQYRRYQDQIAQLREQIAKLAPTLTEANPQIVKLRAQIREAETGLTSVTKNSTGRQDNELAAARHREHLLRVAYDTQEGSVSSDLQKKAQVSLLKREVDSEQQLYQTLLQRAKEAGFASAMQASTIHVVDTAKVPRFAASPRRSLAAMEGIALGGVCGIGFSFYRERARKLVRIPGQIERTLHVQELGVIPHANKVAKASLNRPAGSSNKLISNGMPVAQPGEALAITRWDDTFSITAEAYRSATLSILLANATREPRSYVISSPNDGEGKTTVTSNLGVALSKTRMRVVLVDGDMRKPKLNKAFGLTNGPGLRNLLRGEFNVQKAPIESFCKPTFLPNLFVLPAGTGDEDTVGLLHSPLVEVLLDRLKQEFDIVLIDTPPMQHIADARILARRSQGSILVLRAGSTTMQQAQAALELFAKDRVELVGTILNDFKPSEEGLSNYYSSYVRYQMSDAPEPELTAQ